MGWEEARRISKTQMWGSPLKRKKAVKTYGSCKKNPSDCCISRIWTKKARPLPLPKRGKQEQQKNRKTKTYLETLRENLPSNTAAKAGEKLTKDMSTGFKKY